MGVCRRTPAELEASWIEAYQKRCTGMLYHEIAAEMAGPPHFCGSKTTAIRWVENGRGVLAAGVDEDGAVVRDPMRKRSARREMALNALDALRVKMDQDLQAGVLAEREAYYKLQRQYILDAVTIAGAQAPRELPRVKRGDGQGRPATPGELFDSLLGMPREEIDAALDDLLPDERNDR